MNSEKHTVQQAVRHALYAGLISAAATPSAFAAAADQNSTANATNTTQLGKIEVTGTRIKRTDVETAQPVTIISAQQLKATGLNSIGDILQSVTQSGASLNTTFNNGGNGRTNLDLRYFGPNRVLVLVNGRRWITGLGGPGQQGVDLNEIPVSVIDHIEILQDGASAIYGSDAISGVVNLITVKNFNGAEANAYTSVFHESKYGFSHNDGKVQEYDFTVGTSGDKSSVLMNATYVNQHEVWAGDRAISKEPIWTGGPSFGSSSTPMGRFRLRGNPFAGATFGTGTHTVTCKPITTSSGSCNMTLFAADLSGNQASTKNFRAFTNPDHYNFAPLNYFVTPNERISFYAQGHYDIADNLTFSSEVVFNKRTSQQSLAPSPITIGLGNSKSNGKFIGIGAANPFNPFGVDLVANLSQWCKNNVNQGTGAACATNNELANAIFRRPLEGGLRLFNEDVETYQLNMGLKGYFNLGGNEWDWDMAYGYADDYSSNLTNGLFNTQRLAQALDSPGVNAVPCKLDPTCVPFNFFGGVDPVTGNGSITPAMLAFTQFEEHDVQDVQLRNYTANINGSLADLPAGPLGFAAGYEYLENNGFFHPDATVSGGNTTGNVTQPTDGREKTNAEYFEFDFPLVADAPMAKMLDLDIAERWSQFKWFGGVPGQAPSTIVHDAHAHTGRAALKWQPTDTLLIRGSWSQGFRLPTISELFLGNSDSFPPAADPCAPIASNGGWDGNAAHLSPACGGAHTQGNQQIKSTIGGNPNLHPESAKSRTFGFVYNPEWLPGFDFSADYYNIDLEQAVIAVPVQTILNGCYGGAGSTVPNPSNAQDCALLTVQSGAITDIFDGNVNAGAERTNGIDLASHYKFPSTSIGDFKVSLDWTFLRTFVTILPTGSGFSRTEFAGNTTSFGGFPRQKANLGLNWNYGNWQAAWSVQYIGSMFETCKAPGLLACSNNPTGTGADNRNHVGATVYHDVQASYHYDGWNTDFTLGIRNLFDKQPPSSLSAFNDSFLPSFYRVPGMELWGRISVKF